MANRRARNALIAATGLIVACVAAAPAPGSWSAVTPIRPAMQHAGPAGPLWAAMVGVLGIGELAWRADLLAAALAGACALAAAWAAYQVYRGPGRWLASVATGPITAVALLRWAREAGPIEAFTLLPPALLSTLTVAWLVRSLVHFGSVTPVARTRALGAAAIVAVLHPRSGIALIAIVVVAAYWHGRQRQAGATVRAWARSAGVAAFGAIGCWLALFLGGASWALPDPLSLRIASPLHSVLLAGHLPVAGAYAGLALLCLLVMPLRWRGGAVLVMLTAGGLLVRDADGPLVAPPALLVLAATAAAGWIWLAGSAAPRSRARLGKALAVAATPVALLLMTSPWPTLRAPVAASRPSSSLHRVYEKGLVAPGDAIVSYGAWTRTIAEARVAQGWRPDVTCTAGDSLSADELMRIAIEMETGNRRLLSNSFSAAGNWSASWVIDSGPLFWLVGPGLPSEREFTDLSRFVPDLDELPPREREPWLQLVAERTRFRRALGEPGAALQAMPLSTQSHRGLQTRLQLAKNARPSAGRESELPANDRPLPEDSRALWAAEGGDLLYAHGERERATELLAEAATRGYPEALGALARWQFRAGEDEAARRTTAAMARDPSTRAHALAMVPWLLIRQRTDDAALLIDALALGHDGGAPAQELVARLNLLRAQALVPPPTPPIPDPEAVTRR